MQAGQSFGPTVISFSTVYLHIEILSMELVLLNHVALCTFGSGASIVMWKRTMKPEETTNQKHLYQKQEDEDSATANPTTTHFG